MTNFNSVTLVGRIARDPEHRNVGEKETDMTTFSLAVNRGYKSDEADFFNVSVFGELAKVVANYKSKGDLILVSGRLQNRQYEKNDQKITATNVIANNITFLPSKNDSNQSGDNANNDEFDTEDVPFS